jgi:hypothetical protein
VYNLLKENFDADVYCCTSDVRTEYGLSEFDGFEGDYADFIISDSALCSQLKEWLTEKGNDNTRLKDDATYHIEVKTTSGHCDEPFTMSQNQVEHVS